LSAEIIKLFELRLWVQEFPDQDLQQQGWDALRLEQNCLKNKLLAQRDRDQISSLISYQEPCAEVAEILFLATSPKCQNKGHMSQLLDAFLHLMKNREVWLECREDNLRARHLYLKKGFRQSGRRPAYYKDGTAALLFNYNAS
jgi:ribosomal protein S18 acetylase RimI-like enzyme